MPSGPPKRHKRARNVYDLFYRGVLPELPSFPRLFGIDADIDSQPTAIFRVGLGPELRPDLVLLLTDGAVLHLEIQSRAPSLERMEARMREYRHAIEGRFGTDRLIYQIVMYVDLERRPRRRESPGVVLADPKAVTHVHLPDLDYGRLSKKDASSPAYALLKLAARATGLESGMEQAVRVVGEVDDFPTWVNLDIMLHYIAVMQGPEALALLRRLERRKVIEPLNFYELRDAVQEHYQSLLKDEQVQRWRAEGRAEGRVEGRAEGRVEGRAEGRVEGRAEGRVEGRTEGRVEGWILAVTGVLRCRGMPASAADMERLRGLPVDRMPSIADAYECTDVADLFRRAERTNGGPDSETER